MTPEAQRIAIAEACGYTDIKFKIGWITPKGIGDLPRFVTIPDYLNDLNAIRESERKIIDRAKWYEEIQRVLWPHRNPKKPFGLLTGDIFDIANATAAQRSEAFLKTLNLWTE